MFGKNHIDNMLKNYIKDQLSESSYSDIFVIISDLIK